MDLPLDLPVREVLKRPGETTIPWAEFDAAWYLHSYPEAAAAVGTDDPDAVLQFYLDSGQRLGHSPNIYFDEAWHRQRYRGVAAAIETGAYESAFDAYCRRGSLDRSPHWLFDERGYREHYPDLTDEVLAAADLANRYHHFLAHGCREGRFGHVLFDPQTYLSHFDAADAAAITELGPFRHYLERTAAGEEELPTSRYFDSVWYLRRYPEVAAAIAAGAWRSALHHYLCNDMPTDFDPLPDFSETHYISRDGGLHKVIDDRQFRNGYAHFLQFGARELRSPTAAIDLRAYAAQPRVRQDLQQGLAPDAFAHWLSIGKRHGLLPADPLTRQALAPVPRDAFHRAAIAMLPSAGRLGYAFECAGEPAVSVVMVVRDGFASTMAAIGSLRSNLAGAVELIIIDCGSADETQAIGDYVAGARIFRFDGGIGWAQAATAGSQFATGPAILFLDPAAQLAPGAVQRALDRVAGDAATGAVGGMIVQPNGVIGQAGGIVWNNGACEDYQHGQSPLVPEANFVRTVDWCSTVFLLVRPDLLGQLEGFDPGCGATGHAGADLCLRIAAAGSHVVYDPSIVVFCDYENHRPGADSASFAARHAEALARRPARSGADLAAARTAAPRKRRVLFIEDTVPLRRIGSGFVRANDLVHALSGLDYEVTVFPVNGSTHDIAHVFHDLPDTAEVMHDRAVDRFKDLLAGRHNYYDTVWVARTHNLDRVQRELAEWLATQSPRPLVVLDTEAVAPLRAAQQAALREAPFDLEAAMQTAFRHASVADVLVTVNEQEATVLQRRNVGPVHVVGHMIEQRPTTRSFAQRSGMLFVGAFHSEDSPNFDSLTWFVDAVLPLIEDVLGWETRLTIAGYVAPGVSLSRLERHPRITLRGPVSNLDPLYNACRVFIAPTRFAAGTPYKIYEAASRGLPVVATGHLVRALGWTHEEEVLAAEPDPQDFAAAVLALHQQEPLWRTLREGALRRLRHENNRAGFVDAVRHVLASPLRAERPSASP